MSEAPTLHEIAAMPFPASMEAMRRHYNKDWHKPESEEGEEATYRIEVQFSIRTEDSRTYTIVATSEDEAIRMAEEAFDKDKTVDSGPLDDLEVDAVEVLEVLQ